jgi:putative methionine-R-sulfoxide reductase with GAF domain
MMYRFSVFLRAKRSMTFQASEISTHLNVLNYANVETSITELMEKICQSIKNNWSDQTHGKGKGQWTWSVFSARNQMIEQKAAGGSYASSRRTIPKREAREGMIARVIKQEETPILYEPDTTKLNNEQFLRILDNTQSAIVARIERSNDDVVGVINIESDRKDDFDKESMADLLIYIGKIISQVLSNDGYKTFATKYNLMFSAALSLIEGHASRSPEVFFRDTVELFSLEFRLEAVALFINIGDSDFFTAAHSHIESSPIKFPEMAKRFQCNSDTLLDRAKRAATNTCSSNANISLLDLIGKENAEENIKVNNFVRLYSFDICTNRRCILVAVSSNKSMPPDQDMTMRYTRIIEAFTKTFSQLEQKRYGKLISALAGELYGIAINTDAHTGFMERAADRLADELEFRACYILFLRATTDKSLKLHPRYELVSATGSSDASLVIEPSDLLNYINKYESSNFLATNKSITRRSSRYHETIRNLDIEFIQEPSDPERRYDNHIIVCLVGSKQTADQEFRSAFGIDTTGSLSNSIHAIRQCMNLINNSIKNLDTSTGFKIIHKKARQIEQATNFEELVISLHNLYGNTYQAVDDETLSSAVQMLNESYFTVYLLDPKDNCFKMCEATKRFTKLPPEQPTFLKGKGLTGNVINQPGEELFVPRVEITNDADLNCRSYWNNILSTQFRYFYGKKIIYGSSIAVLTVIGARTPYFQEQVFENTIKSFFGVLSNMIEKASNKHSSQFRLPDLTHQILLRNGPKEKNVFLMIPFAKKDKYLNIRNAVRLALSEYNYTLLVADDRRYTDNMWDNLIAYMDACKLCIAIVDSTPLNSNIAFELGYLKRASTQCLMLKDSKINEIPADLRWLLYESVDFDQIEATVPGAVKKWLKDIDS